MISRIRLARGALRFMCSSDKQTQQREVMEYDVLVVGGGVAGLSTAIKIKQLSAEYDRPLTVCVI